MGFVIPVCSRRCRLAIHRRIVPVLGSDRMRKTPRIDTVCRQGYREGMRSQGRKYTSTPLMELSKNRSDAKAAVQHKSSPGSRNSNGKERKETGKKNQSKAGKNQHSSSLVQISQYSYTISPGRDSNTLSIPSSSVQKNEVILRKAKYLKSIDASALLDPLNYCKGSVKLPPHIKNGRSISGTDAARRLLRGKQEFLLAARDLDAPVILDGHGVPLRLFQHCVDMADALLRHYGPDVVECSFHNYDNNKNDTNDIMNPRHVRVRRRDATNACLPPPSLYEPNITQEKTKDTKEGSESPNVDWEYNMALYLTVMERLAKNLGQVLDLSSIAPEKGNRMEVTENLSFARDSRDPQQCNDDSTDHGDDDFSVTSSPFLFPPPLPRWNVDILRGAFFDLHLDQAGSNRNDVVRPFPIVEFIKQPNAGASGHILVRLQGLPAPNPEFGDVHPHGSQQRLPQQPVTLVFDAYFQAPTRSRTRGRSNED